MKKIKIGKENGNRGFRNLRIFLNMVQAVSLSVFLVIGTIFVVAVGKYGIGTSGVRNEIKNRMQAMNKKAAEYSLLTINKTSYKMMKYDTKLDSLSALKKKYFENNNSNYIFKFNVDYDNYTDIIQNDNAATMNGYEVNTKAISYYYEELDDVKFRFNSKKIYNDAIEQVFSSGISDGSYNIKYKKKIISKLKKLYPYNRISMDFYCFEGDLVCDVSFDTDYADRVFADEVSKRKSDHELEAASELNVTDRWSGATFCTHSGKESSYVTPFTGEFKKVISKKCKGDDFLSGDIKFGKCEVDDEGKYCNVRVTKYEKMACYYNITGLIRKELRSGDDFYHLFWYKDHEKVIAFITYISGIFFIISSIGIAMMAKTSKNKNGQVRLFYRIPMDMVLVIIGAAMSIALLVLSNIDKSQLKELFKYGFTNIIAISIAAGSIVGIFFTVFYTSFFAQIKDSAVINNMIITKVIMAIAKTIKSLLAMVKFNVMIFAAYWTAGIIECIFAVYGGSEVAFFTVIISKILGTLILARVLKDISKLHAGIKQMAAGGIRGKIKTEGMLMPVKNEAECLNSIGEGMKKAVDAQIKSERMKTELITNVSHDIKTPVTAIISYVDLLKKEDLKNENAAGYVEVLDRQSERLKNLIYDLLDLSKASTGNVEVNMSELDLSVFVEQSLGEYIPKMEERNLTPVVKFKMDDSKKNAIKVRADGRHLSRVFDNIFQNICKYAMENTRVYVDVELFEEQPGISEFPDKISISIKNMSEQPLNISGDELTERFVRGDKSRNTEGSGLGLSIAKSLMKLQDGSLDVIIDGDLFKVIITLNGSFGKNISEVL